VRTAGETLQFEGRAVPVHPQDTIASALFRAGVRVFSRSFKYHRRRGLYCLTGDCPNCLVNVDGDPCVRACVTAATAGQVVRRETGWPSADHDAMSVLDRVHRLLPVGFYYKTLLRPAWLWPLAEPWVRRVAGLGRIPVDQPSPYREVRHLHPDVAVIGGGVAGLSAALAAAESGRTVVLCDEGRFGEKVAPGSTRERIIELAEQARGMPRITVLERTTATGIYEGPLVVMNERSFLHLVHPTSVVVATGAVDEHGVFTGNDLPGVWLGRGAARLAGVHAVLPGRQIVMVGAGAEAEQHAQTFRAAGAQVTTFARGRVVRAFGRRAVKEVDLDLNGERRRVRCDALVLATGLIPRDDLARQAVGLPVACAGDAATPGATTADAELSGRRAGLGEAAAAEPLPLPNAASEGIVCFCEDVSVSELEHAWAEGFHSTEIIKRYTTATMGPCQGALCHRHVRAFVRARTGATGPAEGPTTARPPVRGMTLEEAAAGVRQEIHQVTALHRRHLELGAAMEPAGPWRRPQRYADLLDEYWAVRKSVSVMDVGTLGKFLVAGPDATEFLERVYPCSIGDLQPGRLRYALLLGEQGFVVDDGIVCALERGRWYLTFTSAGAGAAEAMLRDWIETWQLTVHLVDLTFARGAINVAGPRSRELLQRVSSDPVDNDSFPYLRHHEITVAGVECLAIRLGFVGELSYELHHPSSQSVELWDALLAAGSELGIRPHGLDALRLLRLEKGHIIVGQDTDFDSTPAKLNMSWATKLDKEFVGRLGVQRAAAQEMERKLVALEFEGEAPPEGAALRVSGRYVGHLTSSCHSPALGRGVGLGWVSRLDGSFPTRVETDKAIGSVVDRAFYDPQGVRLRA